MQSSHNIYMTLRNIEFYSTMLNHKINRQLKLKIYLFLPSILFNKTVRAYTND